MNLDDEMFQDESYSANTSLSLYSSNYLIRPEFRAPRSQTTMESILGNLEVPVRQSIWSKDFKTENKSLCDTYPPGGINLFQQCHLGSNNVHGSQVSANDSLVDESLNDTMFTEISNINYDNFNYDTKHTISETYDYPENGYLNRNYQDEGHEPLHQGNYSYNFNLDSVIRKAPPILHLDHPPVVKRPVIKTPIQTFMYPVPSVEVQQLPKLGEKTHLFKNYLGNYFDISVRSLFFVIKSYDLVDINASFINNVWSSTELGNKRLSKAFKSKNEVYLLFLVNGSGKFCGVAKMTSDIDFDNHCDIWSEESKWKGAFNVEWLLIKDIPNKYFQQFKIANNENKSVTNSRDTQEIPYDIGISMLKIFSTFKHVSSFLA